MLSVKELGLPIDVDIDREDELSFEFNADKFKIAFLVLEIDRSVVLLLVFDIDVLELLSGSELSADCQAKAFDLIVIAESRAVRLSIAPWQLFDDILLCNTPLVLSLPTKATVASVIPTFWLTRKKSWVGWIFD